MYRVISRHLTNLENLFDLLNLSPSIKDSQMATDLNLTRGEIVFENVSFDYGSCDKKKVKKKDALSSDSNSMKRISTIDSENIPLIDASEISQG